MMPPDRATAGAGSATSPGFDLTKVYVHLGLGARAEPLADFEWSPAYLQRYEDEHAGDGADGRLVMVGVQDANWTHWERHPAGDELVVALSGRQIIIQEIEGEQRRIDVRAGQAVINGRGVWHTSDVVEPGRVLFITPGRGTEHRSR